MNSSLSPMVKPPSSLLKEAFNSMQSYPPPEAVYLELGNKVMLPPDEVKIILWLEHLMTVSENHRKGAAKAAETRRQKRRNKSVPTTTRESEYQCGVCHSVYQDFTEEEELWIACDSCDSWHHLTCLVVPETFICSNCEA